MSQAAAKPTAPEPVFGLAAVDAEAARLPFGLWGQFGRHARRYLLGFALLATYQYSQYWVNTRAKLALNLVQQHHNERVVSIGISMVVVALVAFSVRVLSRVAVFNAGRNA